MSNLLNNNSFEEEEDVPSFLTKILSSSVFSSRSHTILLIRAPQERLGGVTGWTGSIAPAAVVRSAILRFGRVGGRVGGWREEVRSTLRNFEPSRRSFVESDSRSPARM